MGCLFPTTLRIKAPNKFPHGAHSISERGPYPRNGRPSHTSIRTTTSNDSEAAKPTKPPAAGPSPAHCCNCPHTLSSRLVLTGYGVRSSCAKKLTRSSSSIQRYSCMRASTAPLRSATRRQ
jgi:hypothetical protein